MGQDDVINLVTELSQNDNKKKCEDHYDYLVRKKRLNVANHDGRYVAEHPTTTNRSAITVSQQWIWYLTHEDTCTKQKSMNMADGNGFIFDEVAEHFTGNFDEI